MTADEQLADGQKSQTEKTELDMTKTNGFYTISVLFKSHFVV